MPTIIGQDYDFTNLTVPGSGPYVGVVGTPVRDTSVVPPGGWPASLLIEKGASTQEYVSTAINSTFPWHAFYFHLNAIDEPTGDIDIVQLTNPVSGSHRLAYAPAADQLYHYIVGGAGTPATSYTLGTFAW